MPVGTHTVLGSTERGMAVRTVTWAMICVLLGWSLQSGTAGAAPSRAAVAGAVPAAPAATAPAAAAPVPTAPVATTGDPTVAAAGDIGCGTTDPNYNGGLGTPTACRMKYTSDLLVSGGYTGVLPLGDTMQSDATASGYAAVYDPTIRATPAATRATAPSWPTCTRTCTTPVPTCCSAATRTTTSGSTRRTTHRNWIPPAASPSSWWAPVAPSSPGWEPGIRTAWPARTTRSACWR